MKAETSPSKITNNSDFPTQALATDFVSCLLLLILLILSLTTQQIHEIPANLLFIVSLLLHPLDEVLLRSLILALDCPPLVDGLEIKRLANISNTLKQTSHYLHGKLPLREDRRPYWGVFAGERSAY